jgi:hypothetical protein
MSLASHACLKSLTNLTLVAEHRRGHGALYDGLNRGRVEIGRFRRALAASKYAGSASGGRCQPRSTHPRTASCRSH